MRIILIGQAAFGAKTLEALLSGGEQIVAAYTRPDKPGARPDPVKESALAKGIPVFQPPTYKDDQVFAHYQGAPTRFDDPGICHRYYPAALP